MSTTGTANLPALVATDLDGTLLDPHGTVTPRTRAALEHAWSLGVQTVFVTARPPRWLDALAEHAGDHGVVICGNGAFRYEVATRRVQVVGALDPATVVAVAADLRRVYPGLGFAAELATGPHVEATYETQGEHAPAPADAVRGPIDTVAGPVGKLLAFRPAGHDPEAFTRHVAQIVGSRGVVADSGVAGLAEIGPPGVSKASTLQRWCDERGIDAAQVWAFGDMPNDLPMLRWAGRSFAVAGAHPQVLATATDVCRGNDDDGVARVLETLRPPPGGAHANRDRPD